MTERYPMLPPAADLRTIAAENADNVRTSLEPTQGLSRRNLLGALAVLPAALPAAAAAEPDPIFAAIERHKHDAGVWGAAVEVWAQSPEDPEVLDAWSDARDALDDAGVDLINTRPTTLRGLARAVNYIREQMARDGGIYMPCGPGDRDGLEVVGSIDVFLKTIEGAVTDLAGKAVRA